MNCPVLRASDLQKAYPMGHEAVRVLRGATVEVRSGELLVVMGSSGSGKSTLLHLLGALDVPDHGRVEFSGENIFAWGDKARRSYRNRNVGFVFQFYHLLPELNVLENVLTARMVGESWLRWRTGRQKAIRDATDLLQRLGLGNRLQHRPNQLSGGERQRVAMARALINRPTLLLADEPTGNLDEKIGADILGLLVELNEAGQTIIMVTHDSRVASCAHRRVQLSEGVIREIAGSPAVRGAVSPSIRKVAP